MDIGVGQAWGCQVAVGPQSSLIHLLGSALCSGRKPSTHQAGQAAAGGVDPSNWSADGGEWIDLLGAVRSESSGRKKQELVCFAQRVLCNNSGQFVLKNYFYSSKVVYITK